MPLETAFFFAQELLKLNAFVLLGVIIVAAFVAYKLFAFVLKILFTGLAFGAFPFIANVIGIPFPITFQSVLWSVLTGIVIYFAYIGLSFGFKILNFAFWPFRRGGKKVVRTVVVKRVEKEEKK